MLGKYLPMGLKRRFRDIVQFMCYHSVESACNEQGLMRTCCELEKLIPDIHDQYTSFEVNGPYLRRKVRGLHAFQMSLVGEVVREFEKPLVVDIGDSSGTHLQYISKKYPDKGVQSLSVNIDPEAVERIRNKGLKAVCARAEDLQEYNIKVDIYLCFEMLEHLMNPCEFLHELSQESEAKYLVITVPYLRNSRVGLHHIRADKLNQEECINAERTHIFELSPEDWKLIVKHSGWEVAKERVYRQYPKRGMWRITKTLWRRFDYEGFYGLILKKNDSWSSKYVNW